MRARSFFNEAILLQPVGLAHRHLEPQTEQLLFGITHLGSQLVAVQFPDLSAFICFPTPSARTILVGSGSF